MIRGRRLRAPRDDRGLLVDPPWPELVSLVDANCATSASRGDYDVAGKSLSKLSCEAREQLYRAAYDYTKSYLNVATTSVSPLTPQPSPLVLSGHQPELFHPGVWAKNFALSALGKATNTVAINLVVDGDVLKSPTIRVPTGTVEAPHVEVVPFDQTTDPMPHEERRIVDRDLFESFGRRAADAVRPLVADPLIDSFWPMVLEEAEQSDCIGRCFSRARHRLEASWGAATFELPQSRLCQTSAFHWLACYLLAQLPRFHEAHNGALAEYRRVEKIRGEGRPVPPLAREEEWFEAPLWVWTADDPHRRRVFARSVGTETELTDRGELVLRLPLSAERSPESAAELLGELLGELQGRGIRLRSRALLTTLFARVVVDATFVHGIGGGKYDELTDEIVRRFFGFEPPGYGILTATRHLPIARPPRIADDATSLKQRGWEMTHHPERFIDVEPAGDGSARALQVEQVDGDAARLIAEKRQLLSEAATQSTTKSWCQAIRGVNRDLQPYVAEPRRKLEENQASARRFFQAEMVLTNREYSSCLFPEKDLRDFFASNFTPTR